MAISQAISQRVARCVEIKFLSMLNKREQKTVNSDSCLNNYIELKQTIHNWWSHPGLSFYSAFTIFMNGTFYSKLEINKIENGSPVSGFDHGRDDVSGKLRFD